jgi:hypothetical protein
MKIFVDSRQLSEVLKALKRPKGPGWSSQDVLSIAQALALVVGGCWVLIQFLLYQRDEIQLKQAELTQSVRLKEMELELSKIKRSREEHELNSLTTYRVSIDTDIKINQARFDSKLDKRAKKQVAAPSGLYDVLYSAIVKNVSDEEFELSLWVLDCYVGQPKSEFYEADYLMRPIGVPAGRWNPGDNIVGVMDWKLTGSVSSVFGDAKNDIESNPPFGAEVYRSLNVKPRVTMVGPLKKEQAVRYAEDFLVRAEKAAYVAFVLSVCFNRCQNDNDLFTSSNYEQLVIGDSGSPKTDIQPTNR